MIRRKLLTILFICILLPVVITLVESARAFISQKNAMTYISGAYVRNLSAYAADRWDEGNGERIAAFLSLVADRGYDRLISIRDVSGAQGVTGPDVRTLREKFIPGLVAYVTDGGQLISCSQNAAVLVNIFAGAPIAATGRGISRGGNIMSKFRVGREDISYVAHVAPTSDPSVYAVAAVTMLSWMGMNDFNLIKLSAAGSISMLLCLMALFFLRRSVILPLQDLSSQVETLEWGKETPPGDGRPGSAAMQVDEISSLKKAIVKLAGRMIEKEELEKRYMMDILKAQENERSRIARDIHDGPIQVVSALIQRIQIANIVSEGMGEELKRQLLTAEGAAQDLVSDLRNICDSLVPPWVSLGIVSCIEESANRFELQHAIKIDTEIDPTIDIPMETTLAIFRIFQEAVSNAVRHGNATRVDVEISKRGERGVVFRVSDNGAGFVRSKEMMDALLLEGKRGLNGMRQRTELLGGKFELISAPGEGTAITITICDG
ncbi:MAG: sensor histidine kinase [Synergistaceae bacterium]|nr:sensor histidine kinase [Synergistaceae bacterium]